MNQTIKFNNLPGQTVVVYEAGQSPERMEQNAKVFTVTAVGHKYIKAGGYNFDKETLRCADLNYSLFIGTPAEFHERIIAERKVRKLMDKVSWHLKDCSLNDLKILGNVLEKIAGDDE